VRVRVCGIRASHDEAEVDVDEVALAVEEQVAVVAVLDREYVAHLVGLGLVLGPGSGLGLGFGFGFGL